MRTFSFSEPCPRCNGRILTIRPLGQAGLVTTCENGCPTTTEPGSGSDSPS